MDGKDLKDVDASSHIENAVNPTVQSGTLIVSIILPYLGNPLWLVVGIA